MNKKTLDYIKTLTKSDEKNLSQKALKTAEEVGELAKVVLPYENAFATTHRFVDRKRILEECADVYLCLMSVAYDLNFSDEEFEEMVNHKMKIWADLQAREQRLKYPIPYEIHVTVDIDESQPILTKTIEGRDHFFTDEEMQNLKGFEKQQLFVEEFKKDCKGINVKPILLDLHLRGGKVMKDLMTSSTFMGNNREAFEEMKRITGNLKQNGWKVVREKIETIPWHPAAPSKKHENPVMPPNCYFESHLNCLCTEDKLELLKGIAEKHGARRSSNVFKRFEDGSFTIMVTYRNYDTCYEDFKEKLEEIKADLAHNSFQLEKEIVEFSVFDTKVSHDAAWILQK